jgi:lysophospholipase L1-like esterase
MHRNIIYLLGLATSLLLSCYSTGAHGAATTAPAAASATTEPSVPADQPAERVGPAGHPNPRCLALHDSFLDRAWQAPVGLVFIGDSITERWRNAPEIWKAHYWQYAPANFGVAGDRTENVLWRIANGELDHIDPKVVVLLIGTNNINDTVDHIVGADTKIAGLIHTDLPKTKLLLLGLFPRAQDPADPKRDKIKQINAALAKLDDGHATRFLDIGSLLLDHDGVLQPEIMKDYLHLTPKGYQIWADAMQPLLDEMMKGS